MKIAEREKLRREKEKKIRERKEKILRSILTDKAYNYLLNLRGTETEIASQIEDIVLYLFLNGQLKKKLTELEMEYIKRKIKGEEGKIYVKTKEGMFSLGDFFKKSSRQ